MDTFTDSKIREAFKNNIPNTTKIIIAQRISSVEDADKIIVLDDGKITDMGSHSELMERSEIYREAIPRSKRVTKTKEAKTDAET